MRLINRDFKSIEVKESQHMGNVNYWEYRPSKEKEERGFYLTLADSWNIITSDAYVVRVANHQFQIPANHYIMIGDLDGGLDFIRCDEILGRPFDAFCIDATLASESWHLRELKVVGYKKDCYIPYPETKAIVPVRISPGTAVLVTTVDMYNKISGYSFSDFS